MLSAYEKVTNEVGQTFVLLPLEEYEQMLEDAWHRSVIEERRGGETISLAELQESLGLQQ
jgi:PHD/YefM family antitoxin component YafN of YafNO toxin-antitoxin module